MDISLTERLTGLSIGEMREYDFPTNNGEDLSRENLRAYLRYSTPSCLES